MQLATQLSWEQAQKNYANRIKQTEEPVNRSSSPVHLDSPVVKQF